MTPRSPDRRSLLAATVLAVVLAAVVAACGIPGDDGPRDISADQLDANLLQGTTPTTPPSAPGSLSETVFLVSGAGTGAQNEQTLRPVEIAVPTDEDGRVTPEALIEALIATKPAAVAPDHDYTNALPTNLTVNSATVDSDGVLHLDLDRETWQTLENPNLYLSVAQIVFTASFLDSDVKGVEFSVDGAPTPVPVENGTVDAGRVVAFATDFPTIAKDQSPSTDNG